MEEILNLINERMKSRIRRDFKRSDLLRDKLQKMGLQIIDTKEGSEYVYCKYSFLKETFSTFENWSLSSYLWLIKTKINGAVYRFKAYLIRRK
jgi:hypothetical protein